MKKSKKINKSQAAPKIDQTLLIRAREERNESELTKLCEFGDLGVLVEIAKSEYASSTILGNLNNNYSISVRHEVAKNENTSKEILLMMLKDKDMLVRDYARSNLVRLKATV